MRGWLIGTLAVAVMGGAGAWWMIGAHGPETCQACKREVHVHSRTSGEVDGKIHRFCCPTCALTEHVQTGKRVRVTELTDHDTLAALKPAEAFLVRGSEVNPCKDAKTHLSHDKQPMHAHFDRCAPGVLAFATEVRAVAFARRHGGAVLRFADIDR